MTEQPPSPPTPPPYPPWQPLAFYWPPPGQAGAYQVAAPVPPRPDPWPGPDVAPTPAMLGAAAAAGLAAAATLPFDRPGLAWLLVTLLVTCFASTLAVRTPAGSSAAPQPAATLSRATWAVTAVVLMGVGTLRAAEWLFPLCVVAALIAGSLAAAGGRSMVGVLLGAVAVPIATLRALPWAARGLAGRRGTRAGRLRYLVGSVVASLLVLVVFGPLLAAADPAFAELILALVPPLDGTWFARWVLLFPLVAAGTLGACFVVLAPPRVDGGTAPQPAALRRLEWALPVGLLVMLFAGFVVVQLAALFGGSTHVLRTTGLTYAEYARGGFWELLAVTMLTLLVIALASWWAPKATTVDRVVLQTLLVALSGLTLVIVASALSRMWAYQQAYGFTVLRLLVLTFELWLGLVYVLVIVATVRLRAGWLPPAVVSTALLALLAVALLNPDRFIAEHNILRWEQSGRIDTGYLSRLSADAVPALVGLPEPLRSCALGPLANRLAAEGTDDWRGWNSGRSAARDILAGYRPTPASCPQQELER